MNKIFLILFLLSSFVGFTQSDAANQQAIDSLKTNSAKKNNASFLWRLYKGLNDSKLNKDSAAFVLTTIGSGPSTYSGDTLNIPNYGGSYLPLSGGTMTGVIAMGSHKITGLSAATTNGDAVRFEQLPNVSSTQIPYSTGSQTFSGSSNLTWNNSINTLSIASINITSNTKLPPISPVGLSGNTDNYFISDGTFFRITASGAYNLTGIDNGEDGRMIILRNIGSNNISLLHESSSSSSVNRFFFSSGTTIVLGADHQISLIYDGTDQRWVDISVR